MTKAYNNYINISLALLSTVSIVTATNCYAETKHTDDRCSSNLPVFPAQLNTIWSFFSDTESLECSDRNVEFEKYARRDNSYTTSAISDANFREKLEQESNKGEHLLISIESDGNDAKMTLRTLGGDTIYTNDDLPTASGFNTVKGK